MSSFLSPATLLELLATCAFGLEKVVARELQALGFPTSIVAPGRVKFQGEWSAICQANLWLRSADRVLILVDEFACDDFDTLFERTQAIAWEQWLPHDASLPVTGRSIRSQLFSVPACQRTVKKAIVQRLQNACGVQTLTETGPVYKIDIAIIKDHAALTIDTTGPSLHKRGYNGTLQAKGLKETLAAAMVQLSFWSPERPFLDPFCHIGILAIEAALLGARIAPGLQRSFASETWPQFASRQWADIREAARQSPRVELSELLIATDNSSRDLDTARQLANAAGVASMIHFQRKPFHEISSKRQFGCLITQLPSPRGDQKEWHYDELYQSLPHAFRYLPTWSFFLLTSHPRFEAIVQKSADRRRKLYSERQECTLFQYHGPPPRNRVLSVAEANAVRPRQSQLETESEAGHVQEALTERQSMSPQLAVESPDVDRLEETRLESQDATSDAPPCSAEPSQDSSHEPAHETSDESEHDGMQAQASKSETKRRPATIVPVFGGLSAKAIEQASLFQSRLLKRSRHLRRWPTKRDITCFRLYERDIPEIPLVVDRYENHLHITEYERPHERDVAQHADWLDMMARAAAETLELPLTNVFVKSRHRQKGNLQHERVSKQRFEMVVQEAGLKFLVNLSDYVDTGLFLDHRITRGMVRDAAKDKRVLNLFGYTGAFSVYAAAGGACETTTVDLSPTYLTWAERNLALNEFTDASRHRCIQQDAVTYLKELPATTQFDLAIVDPPTFSNSKRTDNLWDIQRDHVSLLQELLRHMAPGSRIYFSNNFRRFKFASEQLAAEQPDQPLDIREISRQTVPEDFRNERIHRCWTIDVRG